MTGEGSWMEPQMLLSEAQAADFLNLSACTLQQWRSKGRGPQFVKLNRMVRYRRSDIDAFVESGAERSANNEIR